VKTYLVQTHDVDGRAPARRFKTLAGAVKRFNEMHGSIEFAIAEQFEREGGPPVPKIEDITRLRGVSDYGCVVTFWVTESAA